MSFIGPFRALFLTSAWNCQKYLHICCHIWCFLSPADRHRRTRKTHIFVVVFSHFWVRNPNISMPKPLWKPARNGRFPGPGPIRDRNGGRVPQNTKKTTAKQSILGSPFSTFPGIRAKPYIIVYVFWYFWSPFSRISCTLENLSIPIEQEGADLGAFRDIFRAPKNNQ